MTLGEYINGDFEYLKSCTNNWTTTLFNVRVFSMYNYYPTTCDFDATDEEWDIRNLIWNFKAHPNKPMDDITILTLNENSVDAIKGNVRRCLKYFFGNKVSSITLACIPASTKLVTERRYKYFSDEICKLTGMTNGFPYVNVVSDGESKHYGGVNRGRYEVSKTFFNGKNVLMFDDVVTRGKSMLIFKSRLESCGANVIGGFTIGRTIHHREANPIDLLHF